MDKQELDRFWSKVDKTEGCWNWMAGRDSDGYGLFTLTFRVHRLSYELIKGKIKKGLTIDHLCRNKTCVNPEHLEEVTSTENSRRSKKLITHCPRGHEYKGDNLYVYKTMRQCRKCHRERAKERAKSIKDNYIINQ